MDESDRGFEEIEHTADWALHIWAPDRETLLAQAATGMYALAETTLSGEARQQCELQIMFSDNESMLVAFLNELLFLGEDQGLGFDRYELSIRDGELLARVEGAPIRTRRKEIKAATFHNLLVTREAGRYDATIVFDV